MALSIMTKKSDEKTDKQLEEFGTIPPLSSFDPLHGSGSKLKV